MTKPLPCPAASRYRSSMPRYNKNPDTMTAADELRSLLKWAEQQGFENVAAALRRTIGKLKTEQHSTK